MREPQAFTEALKLAVDPLRRCSSSKQDRGQKDRSIERKQATGLRL
jgi:hypothetical protein